MRIGRYFNQLLAGASLLAVTSANATTSFVSTVTAVGTYGNGAIYIFLSSNIGEPGCSPPNRIDVAATHPQVKQILALAMTARVSGQRVVGQVVGCDATTGSATFDASYNSYFYLQD